MLLSIASSRAQKPDLQDKIDSLRNVIAVSQPDTNKASALFRLGWNLFRSQGPDTLYAYNKRALELSEKLDYKFGIAHASNHIGIYYDIKGQSDSALFYFERAYQMHKTLGKKEAMAQAANNLAMFHTNSDMDLYKALAYARIAYNINSSFGKRDKMVVNLIDMGNTIKKLGHLDSALIYYQEALEFSYALEDSTKIASAKMNIASTYNLLGEGEKCLDHAFESYEIYKATKNERKQSLALLNIAHFYVDVDSLEQAKIHYQRSYELASKINYRSIISDVFIGFGKVYAKENKHGQALDYFQQAEMMLVDMNNEFDLARTYKFMGQSYLGLGHTERAQTFFEKAISICEKINASLLLAQIYQVASENASRLGRDDDAYAYLKLYSDLNDSLLNEKTRKEIEHLNIIHETAEREKEIALLDQKTTAQQLALSEENRKRAEADLKVFNRNIWIVVLGLGVLSIVLLALFWIQRAKGKARRQKDQLERQLLRSQMNPHFVFNSLNSIENFLFKNDKKTVNNYLTKFASLMRLTLYNSEEVLIGLDDELKALELYLELEALRFDDQFTYAIEVDDHIDPAAIKVPGLLIQPFVENAIWHGILPKEEKGKVTIQFEMTGQDIRCTIQDDGVGRQSLGTKAKKRDEHHPMGIKITQKRLGIANALNNTESNFSITDLKDESGKGCGTLVTFTIPYQTI